MHTVSGHKPLAEGQSCWVSGLLLDYLLIYLFIYFEVVEILFELTCT